ncbi:MAG: hypothetical protein LLG00_09825 [Planctomycetaceae bacterium]|nr:hypothetical protein [Planctomycetaceae bacterium]
MPDVGVVLAVLAIVVGAVTVVGHGIWMLLAMIFGGGPKARDEVATVCVFCGRRTSAGRRRCEWCGKELHAALANELRDLQAIERQLRVWEKAGRLPAKTVNVMLARVQHYRQELLHPVAAEVVMPAGEKAAIGPVATTAAKPQAASSAPPVAQPVVRPQATPAVQSARAPAAARAAVVPPKPTISQTPAVAPASPSPAVCTPPAAVARSATKPEPVRPVATPVEPRRSWSEMLAGFMEERNIRWGELIGGLLIVGPAIALVIIFWDKLTANPYLQLTTFAAVCSAVFGAGLYAHHRWKLRSTSLGLLIIATLLVPLHFLATAAVWKEHWGPGAIAGDLASIGIFTCLTAMAGGVLAPKGRWLQVLAVVGGSASILVAARWVSAESPDWWYITAALLPVVLFGAAIGAYILRAVPTRRIDAGGVASLYTLSGTALFAMAIALGMMAARSPSAAAALSRLAMPVALAAAPILATGLAVRRGVGRNESLAAWHVSGTAVALLGMTVMLVALGFAWPHPLPIMAVAAIDGLALVAAAFRWRLPALHAGAIVCVTLAYLTGFHLIYSHLPVTNSDAATMFEMLRSASSGTALVGLFLAYGVTSELLARWGRRRHAVVFAGGAGVMAVLGLSLAVGHALHGGSDALRAAVLCTIYGGGALALAPRWKRIELSYVGLGLLAAAPLWWLWQDAAHHSIAPIWSAIVGVEGLAMAATAILIGRLINRSSRAGGVFGALYARPLLRLAELLTPAGLVLAMIAAGRDLATAAVGHSPALVVAAASIAACYVLLAWQHRSATRTWLASMVTLAGLVHTAVCNYPGLVGQPALTAILTHSTLAAIAAVAVGEWARRWASETAAGEMHRVFSTPLGDSAVLSSLLTLPVLPNVSWPNTWSLALCLYWLAAIWLAIGWRRRNAFLFGAHQIMLAAATGVATTAWLKSQTWMAGGVQGFWHPHSLQAYGVALAALSLAWVVARIALRKNETARRLLGPDAVTVDWVMRHALVAMQLLVVVLYVLPGMAQELVGACTVSTRFGLLRQAALGGGAWLVVGAVCMMLVVAMWDSWRRAELASALLVAATIPCLIAGHFVSDISVASAMRWAFGGSFVVVSAAVWARQSLLRLCRMAHAQVDLDHDGWLAAHAISLATMALPLLGLTVAAAVCQFVGTKPGGPAANTFFSRLGPSVSYLTPLALVLFAMVGHAVRESSARYAFSAGLVAELAVTLGYALSVVLAPRPFGIAESVTLVQLATITAVVWAAAWLIARRWLDVWREGPQTVSAVSLGEGQEARAKAKTSTALMNVQLGMAIAGNAVLIVGATIVLVFWPLWWQQAAEAAGMPLGWLALAGCVAAIVYRLAQCGRGLSPNAVGLIGMAAIALLACTVRLLMTLPGFGLGPESVVWGHRTLMLGWAAYALFIVLATWWVASLRTLPDAEGPPQALVRAAAVWVRRCGLLAVLLGLKAALFPQLQSCEERLWAAAGIAIASGAGATMAVWRRREGWAFSAALGVNLAASLVVWYFHRDARAFGEWWLRLLEANVIASSAVALAWLAAQKRLYQLRQFGLGDSPYLATQVALPAAGMIAVLAMPVAWLVGTPEYLPDWLARLSDVPGWLALLASTAAAAWYSGRALRGNLLHVVSCLILGAGVLIACHVGQGDGSQVANHWHAYHTLMTAWATAALIVLGLGRFAVPFVVHRLGGDSGKRPPEGETAKVIVQGWVSAIGAAVVTLALIHAHADTAGAWWSIGAIVAISASAAVLALWLRLPSYVFVSGLLVNAAGIVGWMAWGPATLAAFVTVNVLCLAAASTAWSLLEHTNAGGVPHLLSDGRPVQFAHLAAVSAVGLLAGLAACGGAAELFALPDLRITVGRIDWIAEIGAAVAATVCLWDPRAKFVPACWYFLGLSATGFALCNAHLESQAGWWWTGAVLSAFCFVAAMLGRGLPHLKPLGRILRVPDASERWPLAWFAQAQAVLLVVAAAVAAWVSLDATFDGIANVTLLGLNGRAISGLSAAMLLATAVVMAIQARAPWRMLWQHGSLAAGVLLISCVGWAWLDVTAGTPTGNAPWLHRSIILMAAAVPVLLIGGLGLGWMLPKASDWITTGRRAAPVLGGLSLLCLLAVLVQERLLFQPATTTATVALAHGTMFSPWIARWAILVVAAALLGLAAGCLICALTPRWDPLRLSDRGRTAYVYAAEALLALIFLHVRITVPGLFQMHFFREYWMLVVMAIAFLGAGLSVLFHRRRMPILSEPLERTALWLPVFPAIGCWFVKNPAGAATWFLGDSGPAFWLLMCVFYGVMAVRKRSIGLAALGVLTGNMGIWVLWHHCGLGFLDHPQLWLIPLALAVLVAEHLDRHRLNETQRTAIRYLALSIIYVSSTTEFWRNIDQSSILPLVTILLAVVGVLLGILLRVRSFVYLGFTFLLVVIGRMIAFAAFEQGRLWVFFASCIPLGVAIIVLFAIFEKRRNDVLAAVERFKQWDQ